MPSALWKTLRLGLLAGCLAFGVKLALVPTDLEPRQPWIAAEEAWNGPGSIALERIDVTDQERSAQVDWIEFEKAPKFVQLTLEGLADLAERINALRRIGTRARLAEDLRRPAFEQQFQHELNALEDWTRELRFADCTPLAPTKPIVVECLPDRSRAVRFELARWDRAAFGLPSDALRDQAATEKTLGTLDRAYYRVVAEYREIAKLVGLLAGTIATH